HDGHDGHDHDEHALPGMQGDEQSLWKVVDHDHVTALNAVARGVADPNAAGAVLKPWDERFDVSVCLESDADAQLILQIPFTASVKLKSVLISGGPGGAAPRRVHLFANRSDVDFDTANGIQPDQTLELIEEPTGGGGGSASQNDAASARRVRPLPEYAVKTAVFRSLKTLTLFIDASVASEASGDDDAITRLFFVGLKGDYQAFTTDPIISSYELVANPADHRTAAGPHSV
ncbi:hypothetical protein CXG81DRAFT_7344, partial [Caulochytrium protostelioides]